MKMMLVDSNQIFLGNIFALTKKQSDVDLPLLRHTFLKSVITLNRKFKADEVVICLEGTSWRKEVAPHYKSHRAKGREQSPYDFDILFKLINELTDEIDEYLPWKVIRHPRAEADDVIGQLTRRHVAGGGDVVIISSDKDFKQLHGSNVVQWNPTMKKHVRVNPKENYLQEHIIRCDQGDFVPNILSEYEHMITEGTRQKSITKKFFEQVMNMSEDDILAHPDLSKNYKRNRELVDLSYTPTDIKMEINDMYDNYEGTTDKKKVFNYFAKKRLKLLIGDIKDV